MPASTENVIILSNGNVSWDNTKSFYSNNKLEEELETNDFLHNSLI